MITDHTSKRSAGFVSGFTSGFVLVEVLISVSLIAFGLIGLSKFQTGLFHNSSYVKERIEAINFSQEKIEELSNYLGLDGTTWLNSGEEIIGYPSSNADIIITGLTRIYKRQWQISGESSLNFRNKINIMVNVEWQDENNQLQNIQLNTFINNTATVDSGIIAARKDYISGPD